MEHIVRFERGHDCIRFECVNGSPTCIPGKGGSHGISGLRIRFLVKGEEGAVQFLLSTGWIPQPLSTDRIGKGLETKWEKHGVIPSDLGYHAKVPQYDGQTAIKEACEFCDGQPCYYDGSGLNASDAMFTLVNGGEESLWVFLEQYYRYVFHGGEYPKPAEYDKPIRVRE